MIESLRIERIAIVEEAELEFGEGLNVLTGETGAGKSIVLGALSLLVGARASAESVRDGADEGAIEAIFRTDCHPDVEQELCERGLDPEDHELVVRRTVSRAGRSRARVAGQLVPVSTLADVFAGRIEISSQHSSQALRRAESHGWLLDAAGDLLTLRASLAEEVGALRALDAEIGVLQKAAAERLQRRDFLAFQIGEIEEAGLDAEEVAGLATERARLSHAGRLREDGSQALRSLVGDPAEGEAQGAADRVGAAAKTIDLLAGLDPSLEEWAERLNGLEADLRDLSADLERYLDHVEADPSRQGAVEQRLAQVEQLQRKYGKGVQDVLATRDRLAQELSTLDGADDRARALLEGRAGRITALGKLAAKLSAGRKKAAGRLSKQVEKSLEGLAMPDARFRVGLEPLAPPAAGSDSADESGGTSLPCGPAGAESPEFRFAANPGEPLRSLQRVASGGELSRVFLAVKNALRKTGLGMVLVFDEVDAGIGGRVAERVGRALAELAAHHQVICITHLPQIAAFADVHFRVHKAEHGGRTRTHVARIDGDERVDEIARMAGGETVTEATREHAQSLIDGSLRA